VETVVENISTPRRWRYNPTTYSFTFFREVQSMNAEARLVSGAAPSAADIHVMQLTTSYWTSRCLHVVAELGIADLIGDYPQSTEVLAKASGTQPSALYRILRLLASVGIFKWEQGAWHQTEASRFLRSDHAGSLRDYVRMLGLPVFWSAFGDLDHSLRTSEPAFTKCHPEGVFSYLANHQEESSIFDAAMTSKSHRDIAAILPSYDFSKFSTIADIAGGRGHLLRAILKASPKTQGVLFDQPHVIVGVAPEKGEKLTMVGGNFFADPMPKADAYLLMNIIHDWPDAECTKILSAILRAMPAHARVLIIETVVPETPEPHLSKELDIAMMALPGGMERTQEEYAALAAKSAFRLQRVVPTASPYSILEMVAA
jgi:O-methyltransferase domain